MNKSWRPVALSLTVGGAIMRFLPHVPNFAPVGALSLFAGARLPKWQAYAVPLALIAITDPILNVMRGFPALTWYPLFTGLSYLISVWIGRRLATTESAWRIGAAVAASSLQFFFISNIGSWLYDYPHTFSGLAACYVAAIPFLEKTFLSDMFFTAVLFGSYAILTRTVATRERALATI
jgi:hypothetical protein